jgi:hypothetical protein
MLRATFTINLNEHPFMACEIVSFQHIRCRNSARLWVFVFIVKNVSWRQPFCVARSQHYLHLWLATERLSLWAKLAQACMKQVMNCRTWVGQNSVTEDNGDNLILFSHPSSKYVNFLHSLRRAMSLIWTHATLLLTSAQFPRPTAGNYCLAIAIGRMADFCQQH